MQKEERKKNRKKEKKWKKETRQEKESRPAGIMKGVLICGYGNMQRVVRDTAGIKVRCFLNKRKLISKNTREEEWFVPRRLEYQMKAALWWLRDHDNVVPASRCN